MWSHIIQLINDKQRFVLTTHANPDLDALGSELALDEYLRSLGKEVIILNSDPVPQAFRFVDPHRRLKTYRSTRHRSAIERAQAIFVLDASGGWDRLGRIGDALSKAQASVACIDHHPDPVDFTHLSVVDTDASATGELIFDLIIQAGGQITPPMADALYLAILTDTGSFRFPKTNPQTHRVAARLIEAGADPARLYKQVYEQYPLQRVRFKGYVLNSLQSAADGQLVWCALDQATLKSYNVAPADLDGFPALGMKIGGVRVSLLCVEVSGGQVKVSLRSDGSLAINGLAADLGGGGHPTAAGAKVKGNLAEVTARLVKAVEELLIAPQTTRA